MGRRGLVALHVCSVYMFVGALSPSEGAGAAPTLARAQMHPPQAAPGIEFRSHAARLGPVVRSALGGQIFGWDINENGNDGVLSEAVASGEYQAVSAVETFDQTTGKITKIVTEQHSVLANRELVVGGIVANDVGLIDDERNSNRGKGRNDRFSVMAPVSGGKYTGTWSPPSDHDFLLEDVSDQQTDPTVAILGYLNYPGGGPQVVVTNVATNTIHAALEFPSNVIFTGLYIIAQDTTLNVALVPVIDLQGRPAFVEFNLASGSVTNLSPGVGRGGVVGIAIDSATDFMCTTSNGSYLVEFYNLRTGTGISEPLPGAGGELQDGAAIAADPVNHLFLVTQPISSSSPSGGSTIYVYHENGNLLEVINGFTFSEDSSVGASIHVNGTLRTGYASGPGAGELQSFTY
jgi:hypothetical protein